MNEQTKTKLRTWALKHKIDLRVAKLLEQDYPEIYAYLEGKAKALIEYEFKKKMGSDN